MHDISVGRGFAVRVQRREWRGRPRIDIRLHYEFRPGDPDTLRPTPKGVAVPETRLDELIAALEALRAAA